MTLFLVRACGYGIIAAMAAGLARSTVSLPSPLSEVVTLYLILMALFTAVWWSRVPEPDR